MPQAAVFEHCLQASQKIPVLAFVFELLPDECRGARLKCNCVVVTRPDMRSLQGLSRVAIEVSPPRIDCVVQPRRAMTGLTAVSGNELCLCLGAHQPAQVSK